MVLAYFPMTQRTEQGFQLLEWLAAVTQSMQGVPGS
jgi:hypothetical protein